jgi:hypothetical protein
METERKADFKITDIQLQKISLNPNDLRTLSRKFQSRVSKALAMSIFKARLPPKDLL